MAELLNSQGKWVYQQNNASLFSDRPCSATPAELAYLEKNNNPAAFVMAFAFNAGLLKVSGTEIKKPKK